MYKKARQCCLALKHKTAPEGRDSILNTILLPLLDKIRTFFKENPDMDI